MARCPYCAEERTRSTGNRLRSLGWSDDGTTNEVECKECLNTFGVDHSGEEPTVIMPAELKQSGGSGDSTTTDDESGGGDD